ncbi:hypothetical protein AB0J48_23855 [Nocardia salmonicida]|uniref:hypothetical protein n=1 Tax=Nocardia salmonicida TaxID=53431 RepID=UPI00342A8666
MGALIPDWKSQMPFDPSLPDDVYDRRIRGGEVTRIAEEFGARLFDFLPEQQAARSNVKQADKDLDDFYKRNSNLTPVKFKSSAAAIDYFEGLRSAYAYPLPLIDEWEGLFLGLRRSRESRTGISAEVGFEAALTYVRMHIAATGGDPKRDILISRDRGNHTFDVVAVINERLVIIEAKGGSGAALTHRLVMVNGRIQKAVQGSRLYLEDLLRIDSELRLTLRKRMPSLYKDIRIGRGTDRIDFIKIHAFPGTGKRSPGRVAVSHAELGTDPIRFHNEPIVNPEAQKLAARAERRDAQLDRVEAFWQSGAAQRAGTVATVGAVVAGAAVLGAGNAQAGSNLPNADRPPGDMLLIPESASDVSSDSGILPGLKKRSSELRAMMSSFQNHAQNALNDLAIMVGGAVSTVSGFVTDILESEKVQAIIDKVSDDWAFAQELLNIAMLFSPVGTVAAAISAAVPIIQLIVEHWDQIRAAFDWVLKNVLTPVAEFFMAAFKVYIAPYRLAFDAVMAGFNGMGGVVGTVVGAVRSTVVGIVKAIGQIFQRLEINIGFPVNKSFGLKSVGDAMVAWASERLADGGLVGGQRGAAPRRASGIEVMAVIDRSVLRAAQAEERKIGYAYRPPFLHDGALPRTDNGPGPRTFDVRVADVDAAFAQIRMLQAVQDARFSPVGV